MSALRRATEVDFKDKDEHGSQGIYVLTTGVPDQEMVSVITKFETLNAFSRINFKLVSAAYNSLGVEYFYYS